MEYKHLAAAILLLASCACFGSEYRLKEASDLALHGIDDYLEWVPIEMLDEAARADVRANGKTISHDSVSASGQYSLIQKFEGDRVLVRSLLILLAPTETASVAYSVWRQKVREELEKMGGTTLEVPCPDKWVEECHFSQVLNPNAKAIGNVFILRKGRSIYSATLLGLTSFADGQSAREFLEEKALHAMAFRPTTLTTEVELEQRKVEDLLREPALQGITLALLVLYIVVYVALYWSVALINRVSGRVVLPRRIAALAGTSMLAVSLGLYVVSQVSNSAALKPLEPYELGIVQGQLIGTYISPLLLLALGVGIAGWRDIRRRDSAQQAKS